MYAVQFVMIESTIHHRSAAMIHQVNTKLPLVCDQFYMVFVENVVFRELHEQTVMQLEKEKNKQNQ